MALKLSYPYNTAVRLFIRGIPIIFLLAISYYFSDNYSSEKAYFYEFNTRLIGLGTALVSIPFFNTFLFGYFSNKTKKQHHFYVKILVLLTVLLMIFESELILVAFSVSLAYLIRSAIVFDSMAKNKSMNTLQKGIFYLSHFFPNYNFQYYTCVFDSIIFTTDLQLFPKSTKPIEAYKSNKNPFLEIFKTKFLNHSS